MPGTPIENTRQLIALIMSDVPKNVIASGAGQLPNSHLVQSHDTIVQFYETARAAALSTIKDPQKQLDRDLLSLPSGRLARLSRAASKAQSQSRFKQVTKVTPIIEQMTLAPVTAQPTLEEIFGTNTGTER